MAQLDSECLTHIGQIQEKIADGRYILETLPCACCGSSNFEVLSEVDRYGLPFAFAICKDCGLIQINPRMREADYSDFYRNHFSHIYPKHRTANVADYFAEERWRGDEILRFLKKAKVTLHPDDLAVDIGCGAGGIISRFKDKGLRTIGIDYASDKLELGKANGLDLRAGNLHSVAIEGQPKLVLYSHVLEHIHDLKKELERIREVIAEGGYLYIEVPGIHNIKNYYKGDVLNSFHVSHIYHFSLGNLVRLLGNRGFKLIHGDEYVRAVFCYDPAYKPGIVRNYYQENLDSLKRTENNRTWYAREHKLKAWGKAHLNRSRNMLVRAMTSAGIEKKVRLLYRKIMY
jgi:SAM-dependent methyltransferase